MQRVLLQTPAFELDAAHALVTGDDPGPLDGAVLILVQTDMIYDRATPLASLTGGIATYHGYEDGVISWSDPVVDAAGEVQLLGTVPVMQPDTDATENAIYGAALMNAGKTKVYAVARLADPEPVAMNGPSNFIAPTIRLTLGKTGNVLELIA